MESTVASSGSATDNFNNCFAAGYIYTAQDYFYIETFDGGTGKMKKWGRNMGLVAIIFLFILGCLSPGYSSDTEEKVAIVCFSEGKAWLTEPGERERSEINLFDWIKIGTVIQTELEAKVVIAFSTGDRYELRGKTKATVGQEGFISSSGMVKKLESVPVMPKIAAISREARPGSRLGGIRLRGPKGSISKFYPSKGTTLLAEEAVFTFEPIYGVKKYKVEIKDEWGNKIFSAETGSTKIATYPSVLKSGANYSWKVWALEKREPSILSEAVFSTVSEENTRARNAFKEQAYQSKDGIKLLLLAQLDMALGLWKEACETLNDALALFPDNEEIKSAMFQIGCK